MSLRINGINELPAHLQAQVREKLGNCTVAAESKYHNIRTEMDGHIFDSAHEAERYGELRTALYCSANCSADDTGSFSTAGRNCILCRLCLL